MKVEIKDQAVSIDGDDGRDITQDLAIKALAISMRASELAEAKLEVLVYRIAVDVADRVTWVLRHKGIPKPIREVLVVDGSHLVFEGGEPKLIPPQEIDRHTLSVRSPGRRRLRVPRALMDGFTPEQLEAARRVINRVCGDDLVSVSLRSLRSFNPRITTVVKMRRADAPKVGTHVRLAGSGTTEYIVAAVEDLDPTPFLP